MYEPSYFEIAWAAIASVGWYIVGLFAVLWYCYPYIHDRYKSWKIQRDEREYAAKYHKNPDLLQQRLSAMEASRQRMQEEYTKSILLAETKEEEKKEKKRQELLSSLKGNGHRLGETDREESSSKGPKMKSLRPEYNPLMGDSSRGYRPPKRSCCKKGGCG